MNFAQRLMHQSVHEMASYRLSHNDNVLVGVDLVVTLRVNELAV